jgi:hypothetical protein
MNILDGWLYSMTADNPARQLWQPRILLAESHCIELMGVTWIFLFGLCWIFTNRLRGTRHI